MTASPRETTDTHNHVYKRGGIIGNIIDTSRPLTHTEALQKQALDTLTQHSQPTRTHQNTPSLLHLFIQLSARQRALRGKLLCLRLILFTTAVLTQALLCKRVTRADLTNSFSQAANK